MSPPTNDDARGNGRRSRCRNAGQQKHSSGASHRQQINAATPRGLRALIAWHRMMRPGEALPAWLQERIGLAWLEHEL
jgi:hypothetical protein